MNVCSECSCLVSAHHGPGIGCEGAGGNCGCMLTVMQALQKSVVKSNDERKEIQMSQAIEVKRSTQNGPVKLYATVPSNTTPGKTYSVIYIRTKGMERWSCTCLSFAFDKQKKKKHCTHIKSVRALVPGKHGAGSMRQTLVAAASTAPVTPKEQVCKMCLRTNCPYDPDRKISTR